MKHSIAGLNTNTMAKMCALARQPRRYLSKYFVLFQLLVTTPLVIVVWWWVILPGLASAAPVHPDVLHVAIHETQHVLGVFEPIV